MAALSDVDIMAAPATPIASVSSVASPKVHPKKKAKTNEGAKAGAAAVGKKGDGNDTTAKATAPKTGAKGNAAQGVAAKASAKAKPKASPVIMKRPGASNKTVKPAVTEPVKPAEADPERDESNRQANKAVKQNASQKAQAWKEVLAQKRLEELKKADEEGDADKWGADYEESEEEEEEKEDDGEDEPEEAPEEGKETNEKRDRSKTAAYKRFIKRGEVEPHIREMIDNSSRSAATALVNKLFKLNKSTGCMEIQQHLPCFAHKKITKETDSQVEGIKGLLKYL